MKKTFIVLVTACLLLMYIPMGVWAADLVIASGSDRPLSSGNSYVINGTGQTATNCSIILSSGSATLTVNGTLTIDNTSYKKSPIKLSGQAQLTLIVNGTLTVKGGKADNGTNAQAGTVPGGAGGYAGIYVPAGTGLTVKGTGKLIATGGTAGRSGNAHPTQDLNYGSGGGGGAGAGIGGNGGRGGDGKDTGVSAQSGYAGEAAGTLNVDGSVSITAIGGGGGGAGYAMVDDSGGGGYPAAGIGGGGAGGGGGTNGPGGGGYSGGSGAVRLEANASKGGENGNTALTNTTYGHGGGYFKGFSTSHGLIGGGTARYSGLGLSGNGGVGGAGGSVTISATARVLAYNGNQFTDGASNHVMTTANAAAFQAPIYAQLGYSLNTIRSKNITAMSTATLASGVSGYSAASVRSTLNGKVTPSGAALYGIGIGSGAGYTEGANGTYSDESSRPAVPKIKPMANGSLAVYGWSAPNYNGNLDITDYQLNIYNDESCTSLVSSVKIGSSVIPTESSPYQVSTLTRGQSYYFTVSAYYGTVGLGLPSEAVKGTVIGVAVAPEAGAYYKSVTVKLTGAGVAENGYTVVYSTDGVNWSNYPSSGITLTKAATIHYGIRAGGVVQPLGEQAYAISKQPITIGSITIHKYTGGTAREDITGQSTAGLDGQQVCAVVTKPVSYIGGGGCIVIAAYDAANRMKTVSITPLFSGAQTANVTSKPITLPGDMASHDIRAFVVAGFDDMAPIGRLAKAG